MTTADEIADACRNKYGHLDPKCRANVLVYCDAVQDSDPDAVRQDELTILRWAASAKTNRKKLGITLRWTRCPSDHVSVTYAPEPWRANSNLPISKFAVCFRFKRFMVTMHVPYKLLFDHLRPVHFNGGQHLIFADEREKVTQAVLGWIATRPEKRIRKVVATTGQSFWPQ